MLRCCTVYNRLVNQAFACTRIKSIANLQCSMQMYTRKVGTSRLSLVVSVDLNVSCVFFLPAGPFPLDLDYIVPEAGSGSCKPRPACTNTDYFYTHTPCDSKGQVQSQRTCHVVVRSGKFSRGETTGDSNNMTWLLFSTPFCFSTQLR